MIIDLSLLMERALFFLVTDVECGDRLFMGRFFLCLVNIILGLMGIIRIYGGVFV